MRSTSRGQHTDFSRCFVSLCSSSLGVITLYSWNKFNMHQIENKLFDFTSTQQKSQNLKCRSILRYKKKEFWHENINNIHVYKISMCSAVQPQLATHNQKKCTFYDLPVTRARDWNVSLGSTFSLVCQWSCSWTITLCTDFVILMVVIQ